MNEKILFSLVFVFGVLISSISQVILKKSAQIDYPNKIMEYLNARVIFAYIIFFCSNILLNLGVYRYSAFDGVDSRIPRISVCSLFELVVSKRKNNKEENAGTVNYYNWDSHICFMMF